MSAMADMNLIKQIKEQVSAQPEAALKPRNQDQI
jgi:hypothetical protein